MDEFGVLVESIGFKAHGRSAPMSKSKPKPKANPNSHFIPPGNVSTSSTLNDSSLPVDELDGIFRSNLNINESRQTPDFIGSDDLFGGSNQIAGNDLDSFWESSNRQKNNSYNSDSRDYTGSDVYDDLLGSKLNQSGGVDDLFGGFSGKETKNEMGFDDLIPGFEESSNVSKNEVCVDDAFSVFESASVSNTDASWPFDDHLNKGTEKDPTPVQSSIDDFDDFVIGGVRNNFKVDGLGTKINKPSFNTASNVLEDVNDLDTIFGHADAKRSSMAQDPLFDSLFPEAKEPVKQKSSSSSSAAAATSTMKTSFSATNVVDDFTSFFGDITTSSGEFVEIDGEPEERRRARLSRHMRMNARMAEALAAKNQRDLEIQLEQEEKHRLGETLDGDIKRWASGKEGNLRALLSSLQQVLWSDCGWRPISLTDMITADSVKKVYKKATLFVHPDKVQQKGANIEQRYIAEKVFDLLKEAWTKFNAEELR